MPLLPEDIQSIGSLPSSEVVPLLLAPGDDAPESFWKNLVNIRFRVDGNYLFWKPRGGSEQREDFFGQILTIFPFSTTINAVQKTYIAVHTASGDAFLYDLGADTHVEMFGSTFSTSNQVLFSHNGLFLYIFDATDKVYKVYNIEESEGYDWLSTLSGLIHSATWADQFDWREENLWGFEEGRSIIALNKTPYTDPETQRRTYRSFTSRIDKVFSDRLVYTDPSGVTHESVAEDAIGIVHHAADLEDYVGMVSSLRFSNDRARGVVEVIAAPTGSVDFYVTVGGIKVPGDGLMTAESTDSPEDIATLIETELNNSEEVTGNWDVSRLINQVFLDHKSEGSDFEGIEIGYEQADDDADFLIITQNSRINQLEETNGNFKVPIVYRGYVVVDLLGDGSFTIPGKPFTVYSTITDIMISRRGALDFEITPAPSHVEKRLLFATRWQVNEDNVYNPSRAEYSNSAFFFAKEVDPLATTFRDTTPDRNLTANLNSYIPLIAGVLQQFGSGQIQPGTIASNQGVLLLGDYAIQRPTPTPYSDGSVYANDKNIHASIGAGTNLTGDPALSFVFEYSDGKKSTVEDSAHILTDAEDVVEPGEEGVEATSELWTPTNPPGGDGNVTVTYPDSTAEQEIVQIPYLSTDSIEDVVNKVVTGINADPDIQLTADPFNAATQVGFTEKRQGVEFNGNIVRVDYPADGAQATLEMSGGEDGIEEVSTSGSWLQIHSINSLVTKVFVLAKIATDYKLIQQIENHEGSFHGRRVFLPNTDQQITDLEAYTVPAGAEIRESVTLSGHIVPAVPFQSPRINEQKALEGSVKIGRIVPWQFDPDKTELLSRIVVFTETNIQVGYLSFGGGGAFSMNASFEVILEGMRASSFDSIRSLAGQIFWPGKNSVYLWSGGQPSALFDVNRYSVSANNNPIDVLYNQNNEEIWVLYPSQEIIVVDLKSRLTRRMHYPDIGNIRAGAFFDGAVYIGSGTSLVETDMPGVITDVDIGNEIEATAETRHIGDPRTKAKILEVVVNGQAGVCSLEMDLQPARVEGSAAVWGKDFSGSVSFAEKTLKMHGASFDVRRRAIMPRLKLTFKEGYIEDVSINQVITENRGKARQV